MVSSVILYLDNGKYLSIFIFIILLHPNAQTVFRQSVGGGFFVVGWWLWFLRFVLIFLDVWLFLFELLVGWFSETPKPNVRPKCNPKCKNCTLGSAFQLDPTNNSLFFFYFAITKFFVVVNVLCCQCFPKILYRLLQPLIQSNFRLPTQFFFGERNIRTTLFRVVRRQGLKNNFRFRSC